ncbi:MAG: hypothetical protein ACK56I_12025 [bacterium]
MLPGVPGMLPGIPGMLPDAVSLPALGPGGGALPLALSLAAACWEMVRGTAVAAPVAAMLAPLAPPLSGPPLAVAGWES